MNKIGILLLLLGLNSCVVSQIEREVYYLELFYINGSSDVLKVIGPRKADFKIVEKHRNDRTDTYLFMYKANLMFAKGAGLVKNVKSFRIINSFRNRSYENNNLPGRGR